MTKQKFKIIVPFYNVEEWIGKCVKSIQLQTYSDFECFLIDDMSTDSSVVVIQEMIQEDDRFTLIKNTEKKYALRNIYEAIMISGTNPEDVIVTLDGDDWFATKKALETLNEIYDKYRCFMTYGSYIEFPSMSKGKFCRKIPQSVIRSNTYRESQWFSSHLRTFKRHLWNSIEVEDLKKGGGFFEMTWDMAFMFPMLEMAGPLAVHIDKMLYSYNRQNPLNDDKVNHKLQLKTEKHIRSKEKYSQDFVTCDILGPGSENSGLGNQLFCIANTLSYARDNQKIPLFPRIKSMDSINKYSNIFYKNLNIGLDIDIYNIDYEEASFCYNKIPFLENNVKLRGYFQSDKYFNHNRDFILESLNIKYLQGEVINKYGDYSGFISIHVRRGDYLYLKNYHGVLELDYFKEATILFPKDSKFMIFSDDIEWCKSNFGFLKDKEFSSCQEDWEDLILMSTCKGHIISNSTFSWWAAWLSGNETIAPKNWFNNNLDTTDLYCSGWSLL